MSGPWVVRRRSSGCAEYLGAEDAWTAFLADAVLIVSEQVARVVASELHDEGDASVEAVLYDEAQQGAAPALAVRRALADGLDRLRHGLSYWRDEGRELAVLSSTQVVQLTVICEELSEIAAGVRPSRGEP